MKRDEKVQITGEHMFWCPIIPDRHESVERNGVGLYKQNSIKGNDN